MPAEENYYGLGDKAGRMNRRNRVFHQVEHRRVRLAGIQRPAIQDHSFFIGLRKGSAYGVFFDNTYRSSFDFGKESHGLLFLWRRRRRDSTTTFLPGRAQDDHRELHRDGGPHATAAAVDAGLSAEPLQLLAGEREPGRSCKTYRQKKFRWTRFISTSTTSRATLPSPSTARSFRRLKK